MGELERNILQELIRERDNLLACHPELRVLQFKIEEYLMDIDDPQERMILMNRLLLEYMRKKFIPAVETFLQLNRNLKKSLELERDKIKKLKSLYDEGKNLAFLSISEKEEEPQQLPTYSSDYIYKKRSIL